MKDKDTDRRQDARMQVDEERLEAAVAWFMRLRAEGADPGELPQFQCWLRTDPRNAQAYRQVAAGWDEVGLHASALVADRRDVLDHAQRASARRAGTAADGPDTPRSKLAAQATARLRRSRYRRRGLAVAASVIGVLGLFAGLGWIPSQQGARHATGHDERLVLTLDDGTTVTLDASSRIRVDYDEAERSIHLQQGQARFDVAKDAARPFRVFARDRSVLALGTQFNVELFPDSVLVTLIEGRVAVGSRTIEVPDVLRMTAPDAGASPRAEEMAHRAAAGPVLLDPGQQLVVADAGTRLRPRVDVRLATSWQKGELVFDNEPLSSAAARVSRYAARPIIVDRSVADVGISGVFKTSEPDAFVEAVASYFPIEVHRDRRSIRLVAGRR